MDALMLKDAQQGSRGAQRTDEGQLVAIEEVVEEQGEIDEIQKRERAVLKELFVACGGAAWRKSSSWNTEETRMVSL